MIRWLADKIASSNWRSYERVGSYPYKAQSLYAVAMEKLTHKLGGLGSAISGRWPRTTPSAPAASMRQWAGRPIHLVGDNGILDKKTGNRIPAGDVTFEAAIVAVKVSIGRFRTLTSRPMCTTRTSVRSRPARRSQTASTPPNG